MPARPGITTRAGTTRAAVPGATMVPVTHEHPGQAGPKPGEHAAGSGHASADLPATARASGITLITPPLPGPSWQARENGCTASTLTTLGSAANRLPGPRSGVKMQVSSVRGTQNRQNS